MESSGYEAGLAEDPRVTKGKGKFRAGKDGASHADCGIRQKVLALICIVRRCNQSVYRSMKPFRRSYNSLVSLCNGRVSYD